MSSLSVVFFRGVKRHNWPLPTSSISGAYSWQQCKALSFDILSQTNAATPPSKETIKTIRSHSSARHCGRLTTLFDCFSVLADVTIDSSLCRWLIVPIDGSNAEHFYRKQTRQRQRYPDNQMDVKTKPKFSKCTSFLFDILLKLTLATSPTSASNLYCPQNSALFIDDNRHVCTLTFDCFFLLSVQTVDIDGRQQCTAPLMWYPLFWCQNETLIV